MSLQKTFEELGNYGCYLISIYKGLHKDMPDSMIAKSIIEDFSRLKEKGYIGDDCEVLQPEKISGHKVMKSVEWPTEPFAFVIGKYHNKRTGFSHFVLMRGPNEVDYDPLGNSVTVREGKVESYRVFY